MLAEIEKLGNTLLYIGIRELTQVKNERARM